jgi:anti-sigma regulatory factor (Ser/Thr protein kinase)
MGQQEPTWSSRDVFPAAPYSVARARAFVTAQLSAHGMHHLDDEVRLVTSELATNAVSHAATPFAVTIERIEGSLRLTVDDGSVRHPRMVNPDASALNGRGLLLVRQLSTDWGVSGPSDWGAKSVWATFDVASARPPAP